MKLKDVLEKIHKHYSEYDSEMAEANVITPEDYEVELLKTWALEMVGEDCKDMHEEDTTGGIKNVHDGGNNARIVIRQHIEESTN